MRLSRYSYNRKSAAPKVEELATSHKSSQSNLHFSATIRQHELLSRHECLQSQPTLSQHRHFRYHKTIYKRTAKSISRRSSWMNGWANTLAPKIPEAFKNVAAAVVKPPAPPFMAKHTEPTFYWPRHYTFARLLAPFRKFLMRRMYKDYGVRKWPLRYNVGFRGFSEMETPNVVYSPYLSSWVNRNDLAKTSDLLIPREEVRHDYTVFSFFPRILDRERNTLFNLMKSENRNFSKRDWQHDMNLQFIPLLLYGIWNQDYELLRQFMIHEENIYYSVIQQDRDGKELGFRGVMDDPDVQNLKKEWKRWKPVLLPRIEKDLKAVEEQIEDEKRRNIGNEGEFNLDLKAAEEDLYRKGWTQGFQQILDRHLPPDHPLRQSSLTEEQKMKMDKVLLEEILDECQISKPMYRTIQRETHRMMRRIRPKLAYEVEPSVYEDLLMDSDIRQDNTEINQVTGDLGTAYLNELGEPQDDIQLEHNVRHDGIQAIEDIIQRENEELDKYYEVEDNEKEQVPNVVMWSDIEKYTDEMDTVDEAIKWGVDHPRRRFYAYEMKRLAQLIFPLFRSHLGAGLPNMQMKLYRVRPVKVSQVDLYSNPPDMADEEGFQKNMIDPYIHSMKNLYLKQLRGEQISLSQEEMQTLIAAADDNNYEWKYEYPKSPGKEQLPLSYHFEDDVIFSKENFDKNYQKLLDRDQRLFELEKKPFRWLRNSEPLDAEDRFKQWRIKKARSQVGDTDLYYHLRRRAFEETDERLDLDAVEKFGERFTKMMHVHCTFIYGISGILGNTVTSELRYKNRLSLRLATDPTGKTNDWQVINLMFGKPRRRL